MAAKHAGGSSRVAGMVASFVAGSVARKVISFVWKRVTSKEPPTDPQDPGVDLKEALIWSAVSGVGVEAARLLATRAVAARMGSTDTEAADEAAL